MKRATKARGLPARATFLLVLGADPERWAKRYGIEPFTHPCIVCGESCTTSIPFAARGFRGLIAPRCACGHRTTPYALVRADGGDLIRAPEGVTS